jgi:hypothetical protein
MSDFAQIVAMGNQDSEFARVPNTLEVGRAIVDFRGISDRMSEDGYDGICW